MTSEHLFEFSGIVPTISCGLSRKEICITALKTKMLVVSFYVNKKGNRLNESVEGKENTFIANFVRYKILGGYVFNYIPL